VPKTHHFEMSIEEQAASLLADGLAYSSREPQLNVFATFAAFFEGIAREGFEMWRYQRNLTAATKA
jgi:transketolase C-terminal domain/subunit